MPPFKTLSWFFLFAFIGIVIQLAPLYFTRNAPSWDGQQVAGYPFPFYSTGGGLCAVRNYLPTQCPPWFRFEYLLIDLLCILIVSLGLSFIVSKLLARRGKDSTV